MNIRGCQGSISGFHEDLKYNRLSPITIKLGVRDNLLRTDVAAGRSVE
jgi:hypothetical protein